LPQKYNALLKYFYTTDLQPILLLTTYRSKNFYIPTAKKEATLPKATSDATGLPSGAASYTTDYQKCNDFIKILVQK